MCTICTICVNTRHMVTFQQAAELVWQGDLAGLENLSESDAKQLASKVDEGKRELLRHYGRSVFVFV